MSEHEMILPKDYPIDHHQEEKRKRVIALNDQANKYENPIAELATEEDSFRTDLRNISIPAENANVLADKFSDQVLKRFEAEQEKWTDKLTGLRNKNAYMEEAPQMIRMELRQQKNCSFLMIDFDHFKMVNDVYGHVAGDMALQKMASLIKGEIRSSDIVYRYGGEEFLVFLPDTESSVAAELAERIRSTLVESSIDIVDDKGRNVHLKKTVSIGCVGTDQMEDWSGIHDGNIHEFLEKMVQCADSAVYKSKNDGRNRVTLFQHDF